MRRRAAVALLAAAAVVPVTATLTAGSEAQDVAPPVTLPAPAPAPQPVPVPEPVAAKPKPKPCATRWDHRKLLRHAVRYSLTGADYRAYPVKRHDLHRLALMRKCANERHNWTALKTERKDYRRRLQTWRFYRHIDTITPFGAWAIPEYIVMRESGGNACAHNPSGAGGFYQFMYETWVANGGSPAGPTCAPIWEQHEVAHETWTTVGSSPWAETR